MLNDTHYKEGKKVTFKKYELNMAGLLFFPKDFDEKKKYPAIVTVHPGGGVKEQCSSLYSWNLAQNGYIALAFDASYQGESEGMPRYLDTPENRVEDIRSAVDYLVSLDYVDENKIGVMGVCAGAGYSMSAIQTEIRLKACAGISTWNVGHSSRFGFPGVHIENFFQKMLKDVAEARTKQAKTGEIIYEKYVPNSKEEINENTSVIQKEAFEYYRTPRCQYPTSVNKYIFTCNDKFASWDAFEYLDKVSPRPLLFVIGSEADTKYFTDDAWAKAKEPKELFVVNGATHVDLYDKPEFVEQVVKKLVEFFDKAIKNC